MENFPTKYNSNSKIGKSSASDITWQVYIMRHLYNILNPVLWCYFLICVTVVQNKADWGVTYTTAKICASNGSTVEMKCTYTYPAGYTVKEEFWCFQDDKDLKGNLDYKDRIQYNCTEKSCTMKMADLKWTDSREYRFRFITDKTEGKYTGVPGITLSITGKMISNLLFSFSAKGSIFMFTMCRQQGPGTTQMFSLTYFIFSLLAHTSTGFGLY